MRLSTKITVLAIAALSYGSAAMAVTHSLHLGARGGADMWLTDGRQVSLAGPSVGIDFEYACRWDLSWNAVMGPKFGVSLVYANATHKLDYSERYTNVDYYYETMDYDIKTGSYVERINNVQVELPLVLSFRVNGVAFGFGAKFMIPFARLRALDVTNPVVTAYYDDFEVEVPDYIVIGKTTEAQMHQRGDSRIPQYNALVTAEIGYEWEMRGSTRDGSAHVGFQAFADYGVWNNYTNNPPQNRLIDIEPILNPDFPPPTVRCNYLTDTYSSALNYVHVGVRVYYSFSFTRRHCYRCLFEVF